jgi:putative protease
LKTSPTRIYEQGGSVYEMRGSVLSFRHGHLRMEDVQIGMRVFKTSDPALNRALRQSFEGDLPIRKQRQLDLHVTGKAGEPLVVQSAAHKSPPRCRCRPR